MSALVQTTPEPTAATSGFGVNDAGPAVAVMLMTIGGGAGASGAGGAGAAGAGGSSNGRARVVPSLAEVASGVVEGEEGRLV